MDETAEVAVQRRRSPAEIQQIVGEFAQSGLRRTEFCRRHGMTLGTLHRYLQRMRAQGETHSTVATSGLVPVELASTSERESGCGLTVVLGRGRRIEVGTGFDVATLEQLIRVLETM
jgi:transposase-like protein